MSATPLNGLQKFLIAMCSALTAAICTFIMMYFTHVAEAGRKWSDIDKRMATIEVRVEAIPELTVVVGALRLTVSDMKTEVALLRQDINTHRLSTEKGKN